MRTALDELLSRAVDPFREAGWNLTWRSSILSARNRLSYTGVRIAFGRAQQ